MTVTETILLSLDGVDRGAGTSAGDGAAQIEEAIDDAVELARRRNATLHALYVVDTGRYGEPALSTAEILVSDAEDAAQTLLAEVEDRGRERGVTVRTRCGHGRPNEELPAYAAEIDADAVVLAGRRRPGRVRRKLERTADTVVTPAAVVGR